MPDQQQALTHTGPGKCVSERLATLGLTEQDILDWIAHDDLSLASIAKRLGHPPLSHMSVQSWLQASPLRAAGARDARRLSADAWLDRAHEAIEALPRDGTQAEIAKMRELVRHAEKRAAIRNPDYSERRIVDGRITVKTDLAQMSDAELIEFARKNGVTGPIIEGTAEPD